MLEALETLLQLRRLGLQKGVKSLLLRKEGGFIRRHRLLQDLQLPFVLAFLALARSNQIPLGLNIMGQLLQAVAAVVTYGLFQPGLLCKTRLPLLVPGFGLRPALLKLLFQLLLPCLQQLQLTSSEPGMQGIPDLEQVLVLLFRLPVALGSIGQRLEHVHLAANGKQGLMCLIQVVVVLQQCIHAVPGIGRLQHVLAHEVRQVVYGFQGHGLVKQVHGLLVAYPHAAAKPCAIGLEVGMQFTAQLAQLLAQGFDVVAEVAEMLPDGQCFFCGDIQAQRLAGGFREPEYLRQREGAVKALVAKTGQQDAIAVGVPKRHGTGAAGFLVVLALVVAQHVGAQIAFACGCACGLVVGDVPGLHQQSSQGVHQSGFARADVAREQAVVPVQGIAANAAVKSAPVERLQLVQTKTGAHVVGHEIQASLIENGNAHASSPSDSAAWR